MQSFFTAFLLIVVFTLYRRSVGISFTEINPEITSGYMKFVIVFLGTGTAFYLCFCLFSKWRTALDVLLLLLGSVCLIVIAAFTSENFNIHIVLFLAAAVLCYFFFIHREHAWQLSIGDRASTTLLVFIIVLSAILIPSVGIIRHRVFLSSGFDLGIFDQMFYFMSSLQAPVTTIEGIPVNHMLNVHFSPILYLLVPVFSLSKSPETLIFLQCLFVALAAIPLFKLCKFYQLPNLTAVLICVVFLLHPGILGGEFRDFHENKLLPFFLLSFIYFFETNSIRRMAVCMLLTLFVKEDAAIYILFYGIGSLLRGKAFQKRALWAIAAALLYFILVSVFILDTNSFTYRYDQYITDPQNSSFIELIKVFFTNPLYYLMDIFSANKLTLIGMILFPLALIPLSGLFHLSEAILFIPFILICLMQNDVWQSIDSQYHYGSIVLLFTITLRSLQRQSDPKRVNMLVSLMLLSTLIFSSAIHLPKTAYFKNWQSDQAIYERIETAFQAVPKEASVAATNHFYPHLSEREEIYQYWKNHDTDVIAIDMRPDASRPGSAEIIALLNGASPYGVVDFIPDWFIIMEKEYPTGLNDQTIAVLETIN